MTAPGVLVTHVHNDFRKGTLMTRTVKIPDATHPITISPTGSRVTVRVGGVTVADTDRALSLAEANYPVVQYIPLEDVDTSLLDRTTTQSYCPYKGDASYYSVKTPDGRPRPTSSGPTSTPTRRSPRSPATSPSTPTAPRSPSPITSAPAPVECGG